MATPERSEERKGEGGDGSVKNEEDQEKEDSDEDGEEQEPSTHLPLAPSSEAFDVSTTIDPSYIISLIRQLLPQNSLSQKQVQESGNNEHSISSTLDEHMHDETGKEENDDALDPGQMIPEEAKDPWEDSGCILWDLAASRTHAEMMVSNLILEVLLGNLHVSKSFRLIEICLGIIGNLSCHKVLSNTITSTNGLIEAVVEQLFLDDSACLSEAFRVLSVSLRGSSFASWAEALLPDQILRRILWIIENTLNSTLLEKSIEFLLTVADNQDVGSILLKPLTTLGLPNVIVCLLTSELEKFGDGNQKERLPAIDLILHLFEELSAIDGYSVVLSSNSELFDLVCGVVKLPDKIEASSSCVSAVITIANLLADDDHLTSRLLDDCQFLESLLDLLPLVSEDSQARDALWCIVARCLVEDEEDATSPTKLHRLASLLLEKSNLIEDDLDDHPVNSLSIEMKSPQNPSAIAISLRRIANTLEQWKGERSDEENSTTISANDDSKSQKLLQYCKKYGL